MNGLIEPKFLPQMAAAVSQDGSIPTILWNGVPFIPLLQPSRKSVIVRTAPAVGSFHISTAIPAHLIQIQEHRLEFVTESTTLLLVTNAPEAFSEIPEAIRTDRRDIGSFYSAEATWRGRSEKAFVSASLTDPQVAAAIALARADHSGKGNSLSTYVQVAGDILRTGLIIHGAEFTAGLSPDEILLANLLAKARSRQAGDVFSYEEIGSALGVSGETIRRRLAELSESSPRLGCYIKSLRANNNKGDKIPARPMGYSDSQPED